MKRSINDLEPLIIKVIERGLVPFIEGPPGIGKSGLYKKIAKTFNLFQIDLRLTTIESVDMSGLPYPDVEANIAKYMPMDFFPTENKEIPKGYDGWLLTFDELPQADVSVQKAVFQVIYDRMIGQKKLHDNVAICAAGNGTDDRSGANELLAALSSRMINFEMKADLDSFLDWAYDDGLDHRITSFLKFSPDSLYTFNPESTDKTFACPRTYEFLHDLTHDQQSFNYKEDIPLVAGTVSLGVANEYIAFTEIYKDLVTFEDIKNSPTRCRVPSRPDVQFALSGMIAARFDPKIANELITYLKRLPTEFQARAIKEIIKRDQTLGSNPAINQWLIDGAKKYFSGTK